MVGLIGAAGAGAEADGIILGYNIEQGMLSQLVLRSKEEIVQEVGGQKIKRIEEVLLEYEFEKKESAEENGEEAYIADRFCTIPGTLQVLTYNSADGVVSPPEMGLYKGLEGMIGEVSVTRDGLFISFRSSSSWREAEEAEQSELLAALRSVRSDEFFQKQRLAMLSNNAFTSYPDGPRQVGAVWPQPVEFLLQNGILTMMHSSACAFHIDDLTERTVVLKFSADVELYPMESQTEGKLSGEVEIDRATGLPLQGTIHALIAGEVERLGLLVPVTLDVSVDFKGSF